MELDVRNVINSLKGISGTGDTLYQSLESLKGLLRTLEPGDIVDNSKRFQIASAAPIAYDLWYLFCDDNFMAKYYENIDGDHYDYKPYMEENLDFLAFLPGLKPIKTLRNLDKQLSATNKRYVEDLREAFDWYNNGVYWINTLDFELWAEGNGAQYPSDGPKEFKINDCVGYLAFPIGQLGVMEVISLMQETVLREEEDLPKEKIPSLQSVPSIFPEMKDAGQNYCYGKQFVESAYLIPDIYKQNVEYLASEIKDAPDVKPKKWMRYWIKKEDVFPVPGEFLGILVRPVACPPHVWWFQESAPFLYSGNWVENHNLTSGIVTKVTLEEDRTDDKQGNQYKVKVQGCEIIVEASDFYLYEVEDRVAVVKMESIDVELSKSFTWLEQPTLKEKDKLTEKTNYVIMPAMFYRPEE